MTLRGIPLTVPEQIADIYEQLRRRKPMSGDPPQANLLIEVDGTAVGTAQVLNFLQGSGVILGGSVSGSQVNLTISSSGGTGSHSHDGTGANSSIWNGESDTTPAVASALQTTAGGDGAAATAALATALGSFAQATGTYSIAIGGGDDATIAAQATYAHAIAIGVSAVSAGGVAIGDTAQTASTDAVAIGQAATAGVLGQRSIAIGGSAVADSSSDDEAIAIGYQADSQEAFGVSLGSKSSINAEGGTAIGHRASASLGAVAVGGHASTSLGNATFASGEGSIAIGGSSASNDGARAFAKASIAIGGGTTDASFADGATVDSLMDGGIAIGTFSKVSSIYGISLGVSATVDTTADQGIAIGVDAFVQASHAYSTALGHNATTTAAHQIMLGTSAEEVYFPGTAPLWIPTGAGAGKVLTSDASGHATWGTGGGGGVTGFAVPNLTLGTANAAGAATTVIRSDATILAFDATTPSALTVGGAGSVGSAGTTPHRDHTHPMPGVFGASGGTHSTGFVPDSPSGAGTTKFLREDATWAVPPGTGGVTFGTPALTLGTTNAAGSIDEAIRRDATILVFDSTNPVTQAFGDAASPGSGTIAAYRNHKHAMPTAAITTSGLTQATARLLGRTTASTGAVEEITVGTGLSLSAGSLTATGGTGSVATDTIWDAKGDLAVGTGADTAAKLAVGADNANLVLTPDSSQSTGLKWATLGTKLVYKTADESVTSSTTLQDDDHLSFSIAASETWAVRFVLFVDGATAGDFKPALAGPTGATAQCGVLGVSSTETTFDAAHVHNEGDFGLGGAPILGTLGAGASTVCYFEGVVFNGANAGTVKLQWAQGTSSGTATKLLKGSYLMAWKLA